MVFTPAPQADARDSFRQYLEESYQRRSLVHLAAGSSVPLIKKNVWLVVRGMVSLSTLSYQGDELLVGLAGPNEPFGEPLSNLEAYQARALAADEIRDHRRAVLEADAERSAVP